jgi:hypothetical protein
MLPVIPRAQFPAVHTIRQNKKLSKWGQCKRRSNLILSLHVSPLEYKAELWCMWTSDSEVQSSTDHQAMTEHACVTEFLIQTGYVTRLQWEFLLILQMQFMNGLNSGIKKTRPLVRKPSDLQFAWLRIMLKYCLLSIRV